MSGEIKDPYNQILYLNDYQEAARKTAIYDSSYSIVYPMMGLVGEAGECMNKLKKVYRDHYGNYTDKHRADLASELGDVLWYLALASHDLGYTLSEVAQLNIHKLAARKEKGTLKGSGDDR